MKLWHFRKEPEKRNYSGLLLQAAEAAAAGTSGARATATAALTAAAGATARAFAAAEVTGYAPAESALTPGCLAMIGRSLIRSGEWAALIVVDADGLALLPAQAVEVFGRADPRTWDYSLTLAGPSDSQVVRVPGSRVLHFRYASDPAFPWIGVGPVREAALSGKLAANVAEALRDETSGPRGHFLPVPHVAPDDGDDADPLAKLTTKIASLAGRLLAVEDMTANWEGGATQANRNWGTVRFGANPPAAVVELAAQAAKEVLGACGYPPELAFGSSQTAAAREAYRRWLHATISPLGRMVQAELRAKIDGGVTLSFDGLNAADIASKARGFQSLVGGGMEVERAAALAGLLASD